MTYNFDEIIDRRHTNSENVDGWRPYIFHCGPERVFPYKDEERDAVTNKIQTAYVISGFTSVTILSVFIASFLAKLL